MSRVCYDGYMKLYLARHGQTPSNVGIDGRQRATTTDEPLTDVGIEQAKHLAEELRDVHFDAIISSQLQRALQTAVAVNQYHGLDIEVIEDLQEREAPAYVDINTWNDLFDFDKALSLPGTEPLPDFFDRVYKVIDELKVKYADKTILVVSHGGVHHVLYAYANNLPRKGNVRISRLKNCEYLIYEI